MTPSRTNKLASVWKAWETIQDTEVLEDRREYDQEMLSTMYGLNEEQSHYLHQLIKLQFDPNYTDLYSMIPSTRAGDYRNHKDRLIDAVVETFGESMHQSFDGWEDGEKVIISLYLMDVAIAANITYRDRCKEDEVEPTYR